MQQINTEKEKTRHGWIGKVIHLELCKKLKFDHSNKWYMHNPTSVLQNETHKLLWDFDTQTDHLKSTRRPDLIIIKNNNNNNNNKKRICNIGDFAVPADHRIKLKEIEKKNKYLDLARELKNSGTWKWRLYQIYLMFLVQSTMLQFFSLVRGVV